MLGKKIKNNNNEKMGQVIKKINIYKIIYIYIYQNIIKIKNTGWYTIQKIRVKGLSGTIQKRTIRQGSA